MPSPTDGANTARLDTDGKSNAAKPDASGAAGSKAACEDSTWAYLGGKCAAQDKPRKARVRAAASEGKANAALVKLLARALGVAPRDVVLLAGASGRG